MSHDQSPRDVVAHIARTLDETDHQPLVMIRQIVRHCGPEQALTWLREAQEIEANGGMLTANGSRRRTPGGVFFKHVRNMLYQTGQKDTLYAIFTVNKAGQRPHAGAGGRASAPSSVLAVPPVVWDKRGTFWKDLESGLGTATALKLKLIGIPGKVVDKGQYTFLVLTHRGTLPGMPHGIPVPPAPITTPYVATVSAKHWRAVAGQPHDSPLVLKGATVYDPELESVSQLVVEPPVALERDDRLTAGEVRPPTLTVIGRPGTPLIRPDLTLVRMVYDGPLPALPKGIVAPNPAPPTTVGLYISAKQWRRVADALARDPDDTLIAEGTPYYDRAISMIAVNVSMATTKTLEQAKRQAHTDAPGS